LDQNPGLSRQLGLVAVVSVVIGNMLGSGIFFTPGELASVAERDWQVYLFWALCGLITLCGALTLAELASLLPRAGASYHIIREGFGPFWAFLSVWMQMWVSGPGSVAGIAIVFGEFFSRFLGETTMGSAPLWGAVAILFFAAINLRGIRWGGATQITLTVVKVGGLIGLVAGSLWFASAADVTARSSSPAAADLLSFVRLVGLGVAAVMFTYDGWIDVSHVAGEVVNPRRNLPLGLGLGVAAVTAVYLVVNYAYLRVVPLDEMQKAPTTIAFAVAAAAFGPIGGSVLNGLLMVSIFGALGGLVMTLPRLFFAAASGFQDEAGMPRLFAWLARISATAVPVGSIVFCASMSIAALLFFGSFSRIVNSFVVPLQLANVLLVAAIFRLRGRIAGDARAFRTPGYPVVPLVYIVAIGLFLASAVVYQPFDTMIGVGLTATGVPFYWWLSNRNLPCDPGADLPPSATSSAS
jgi:APA family basic amino acid/polyamine antiporter